MWAPGSARPSGGAASSRAAGGAAGRAAGGAASSGTAGGAAGRAAGAARAGAASGSADGESGRGRRRRLLVGPGTAGRGLCVRRRRRWCSDPAEPGKRGRVRAAPGRAGLPLGLSVALTGRALPVAPAGSISLPATGPRLSGLGSAGSRGARPVSCGGSSRCLGRPRCPLPAVVRPNPVLPLPRRIARRGDRGAARPLGHTPCKFQIYRLPGPSHGG